MGIAADLADWASGLRPTVDDLALADRSPADTVAVAPAARDRPVTAVSSVLGEGGRWAAAGHVLDVDDLQLTSTSRVSVVCVPAVLSVGGSSTAYLAAAGVMARLGDALGWSHYRAGWHATGTAGAFGAAVGASVALGSSPAETAVAMAPAATALLDPYSGSSAFTDSAVQRPSVQSLASLVETVLSPGGDWLLAGSFSAVVETAAGSHEVTVEYPPGSPARPPTPAELAATIADCTAGLSVGPVTWSTAASVLRTHLGGGA